MNYLDHAATTPLHPAAIDAMVTVLRGSYGNPSGVHDISAAARSALEDARDTVASFVGCQARELVFTGGGTESLNMALRGNLGYLSRRPTVLTSAIEHDAVRATAEWLAATGQADHETLPVTASGVLDLAATAAVVDRLRDRHDFVLVAREAILTKSYAQLITDLEKALKVLKCHKINA